MKHIENKSNMSQSPSMSNCTPQETVIKNVRLAAAYVPYQILCTLFSPLESLKHGTAFPELFSPYKGEDKNYNPCSLEASKKERF
ncbi:spore coat associated protein CotJA [Clostridium sp.]|uniref:spore coat associated protein CotJA n=1 Tax=Clostridium sp. TaxID=1506 RepID=UPI003F4C2299